MGYKGHALGFVNTAQHRKNGRNIERMACLPLVSLQLRTFVFGIQLRGSIRLILTHIYTRQLEVRILSCKQICDRVQVWSILLHALLDAWWGYRTLLKYHCFIPVQQQNGMPFSPLKHICNIFELCRPLKSSLGARL